MNSIAINICLLPSLEIKEICTRVYKQDQSDYLDEELPYIPHITLLQKVVSEEDLEKLTEDVKKLQIDKFDLETNNFFFSFLLGLKIKRTEQITALQKKIIDIASKYKSVVATKEAFITGANFCEDSIDRVENYLQYLNFENDLHITLGETDQTQSLQDVKLPEYFICDTLCIGIMGNYCSVREKLFQRKLGIV